MAQAPNVDQLSILGPFASGQTTIYSEGKMRRQSFFISTTVQPLRICFIECFVELPDGWGAIVGKFSNCVVVVDE
jgi:hypothetical protein